MSPRYVPDRGHLIWLNFNPQLGHEQTGRRPAMVLSPARYNGTTDLAIICPITSRVKGYPFEVRISARTVSGVVLADAVRSVDWVQRKAEFIEAAPPEALIKTFQTLCRLIDPYEL